MINTFASMTGQIGQHRRHHLRWASTLCLACALVFVCLHFLVWHIFGAGVACTVYAPVCVFVIWGSYQYDQPLESFVNVMVSATVLLMLAVICFQRTDVTFDHWILAGPALAFTLCRRQMAALWSTLSLLGLLAVRPIAQHPAPLGSSVSLALAIAAISIGLYLYSAHVDNIERFIVELGNTDSLTGTLNRRSLDEILRTEFRRNVRQQISMTAFMIDVDHFKLYNDHYGHVSGDRVLAGIAEALRQSARRPGDFVFRYGGEEFFILCSGVDSQQAAAFAETLRANIAAMEFEHRASPAGRVTASIGYRHADSLAALSPEKLVDDADKALYRAKGNGRNCVECWISA